MLLPRSLGDARERVTSLLASFVVAFTLVAHAADGSASPLD